MEMTHLAKDGEDLVLSPGCPKEEMPSGKAIPPGETKKEETQKWQEWWWGYMLGKNRNYACGKRETD